jgi:hypothetical protein
MENMEENQLKSENIGKKWKTNKLHSEIIWRIWKMNSDKICTNMEERQVEL